MARSTALVKAKDQLAKARKSTSTLRRKYEASKVPSALMGGGVVLGGAALAGLVGDAIPEVVPGLPGELAASLVLAGVGTGMGGDAGATLIFLAAGMAAPSIKATVKASDVGQQTQASVAQVVGG